MDYKEAIFSFQPRTDEEREEKRVIMDLLSIFGERILFRENSAVHMTASGFIVNETFDKTLMVYHTIYQSWAWTGGHADGQKNLLSVAVKEAGEETGIRGFMPMKEEIACLNLLPVVPHRKKGNYIPAHLHISAAYLLVAKEGQPLQIKPDENSGVQWLPLTALENFCTEAHMLPIYEKLRKQIEGRK